MTDPGYFRSVGQSIGIGRRMGVSWVSRHFPNVSLSRTRVTCYVLKSNGNSIKSHIEPLAIAVNIAQGANTRCDQVVLVLGRLYRDYIKLRTADRTHPHAVSEDDDHPVTAVIHSIEKRWAKVDQDLFISAFFLNPFINRKLRNGSNLTLSVIMGMIHRLYTRVFQTETCPPALLRDLVAYENRQGMFSDNSWPLVDLCEALKCQQVL